MNTINDRIRQIIDALFNKNIRSFSVSINENYQTIRNIVGERNSIPSSSILESMMNSIESLNPDWLLTGRGSMLKKSSDGGIGGSRSINNLGTITGDTSTGNIIKTGGLNDVRYAQEVDGKVKELELIIIRQEAEIKSLKSTIEILIQTLKP